MKLEDIGFNCGSHEIYFRHSGANVLEILKSMAEYINDENFIGQILFSVVKRNF